MFMIHILIISLYNFFYPNEVLFWYTDMEIWQQYLTLLTQSCFTLRIVIIESYNSVTIIM